MCLQTSTGGRLLLLGDPCVHVCGGLPVRSLAYGRHVAPAASRPVAGTCHCGRAGDEGYRWTKAITPYAYTLGRGTLTRACCVIAWRGICFVGPPRRAVWSVSGIVLLCAVSGIVLLCAFHE